MISYVSIIFHSIYASLFSDNTYDVTAFHTIADELEGPVLKITNHQPRLNVCNDPFLAELKSKIKRFYTTECINESSPAIV